MQRVPISSSAIRSAGHELEVLEIEFTGGSLVSFLDVPAHIYRALINSPSPGRFYAAEIRDKYKTLFNDGPGPRGQSGGRRAKKRGPKPPPKPAPGSLNPGYNPHGTRPQSPPQSPRAIKVRRV
jgi:KTSC domain